MSTSTHLPLLLRNRFPQFILYPGMKLYWLITNLQHITEEGETPGTSLRSPKPHGWMTGSQGLCSLLQGHLQAQVLVTSLLSATPFPTFFYYRQTSNLNSSHVHGCFVFGDEVEALACF